MHCVVMHAFSKFKLFKNACISLPKTQNLLYLCIAPMQITQKTLIHAFNFHSWISFSCIKRVFKGRNAKCIRAPIHEFTSNSFCPFFFSYFKRFFFFFACTYFQPMFIWCIFVLGFCLKRLRIRSYKVSSRSMLLLVFA